MSFNVRFANSVEGLYVPPNGWFDINDLQNPDGFVNGRRLRVLSVIRTHGPDILGVQEPFQWQVDDLRNELPEYDYFGVGRDDGQMAGEHSGIFFRADRFTRLDGGHFWLSNMPDVPGTTFTTGPPRMATWVILHDQQTQKPFFVLNTHWSLESSARTASAQLIRAQLDDLVAGLPSIVMGDLNATESSTAFQILRDGESPLDQALLDAYRTVFPVPQANEATFHGFTGNTIGSRIDHILVTPGYFDVLDASIVRSSFDGLYPSDHYPVTAVFLVPESGTLFLLCVGVMVLILGRMVRAMRCVLAVCVMSLLGALATADEHLPGREAADWDAVFARSDGWTGGDGAYSVPLGDGRVVWLFSDTWIGKIADGQHVPGSHLVNNTIAIHARGERGAAPQPDQVEFLWGPDGDEGRPTAWIVPTADIRAAAGPAAADPRKPSWYWLADGVEAPGIAAPNPTGKRRLVIFLWHVGRTPEDRGVWSFQSVGGALAVVENPRDPPSEWRARQYRNPHAIGGPQAGEDKSREVSWGCEVLALPGEHDGSTVLHVFGVRQGEGWDRELVLATVDAARVEEFDAWRFRTAESWSSNLSDAAALAHGMVSEFSIQPLELDGVGRWIMIHSEPFFGAHILVRTADTIFGPWSEPQPVYRVPGVAKNKDYFTYAAKGHPELARPGELLISYVINSHDFGAMFRDADIYRPRFVRVPLAELPIGD